MLWFGSKRKFEDSTLGQFTRVLTYWRSGSISTPAGDLGITIAGDNEAPSARGVEIARQIIDKPATYIADALAHVRGDAQAKEFIEGNGEIVVDGFSVQANGSFAVELSLTNWPDSMISVHFQDGRPCKIELGD